MVALACEEHKPILPLHLDFVETPSAIRYQLIQHIPLYCGDGRANFELIPFLADLRCAEADAQRFQSRCFLFSV